MMDNIEGSPRSQNVFLNTTNYLQVKFFKFENFKVKSLKCVLDLLRIPSIDVLIVNRLKKAI